ncbi:hypothetical protein [Pseudomonas oryzicola]|uniref:Uncharacterized protein n=1 Tax=Pseudomonas oryzicola TaxID=485876 RepID=A0ABS6QEJ1_9PSED|nr:hypothetical protein [Pseudomonas oryzicola]MBV4492630.1 hypothetical protein [Pseudomonas oryzicola]
MAYTYLRQKSFVNLSPLFALQVSVAEKAELRAPRKTPRILGTQSTFASTFDSGSDKHPNSSAHGMSFLFDGFTCSRKPFEPVR